MNLGCFHILSRLRHFRGHGIHSPFVYGMKRKAFMQKNRPIENIDIYNILIANGIRKKVARELEKVHNYCNFHSIEIVDRENTPTWVESGIFYVIKGEGRKVDTVSMLDTSQEAAIAVLDNPKTVVRLADCITIQRRRYTLLFKKDGIPAQAYKL